MLYAWFKHLWANGVRQDAFAGLQRLAQVDGLALCLSPACDRERVVGCALCLPCCGCRLACHAALNDWDEGLADNSRTGLWQA